jgi:hypothetical protein
MSAVETMARWVKAHPHEWKQAHTAFIDAQFEKHRDFVARLKQQPGGVEKLRKLYAITNATEYDVLRT